MLFDKFKKMMKIRIIGLDEGNHPLDIQEEKLRMSGNDYVFDNVGLVGELIIHANKVNLKGSLEANIDLNCDRSGKDFTENIKKEVDYVFKFDTKAIEILDDDIDNSLFKLEGNQLIISDLIYEELLLSVPLKKIAPEYRDVDFEKLFPDFTAKIDKKVEKKDASTWNELKKLNFN